MKCVNPLRVTLSAKRLNLDIMPWLDFDRSEDELVGAATMKAMNKKVSPEQLKVAASLVSSYLEIKNDEIEHSCNEIGPFIFGIKSGESVLGFIRGLQSEFMPHRELDHIKLKIRFE